MPSDTTRFLTTTAYARLVGLNPSSVWRACKLGRLPCLAQGRRMYVDMQKVDEWIVAQTAARRDARGDR